MIPLECSFLGQFQVVWQGVPLTGFRSDKIRALLAYLVVEAGIPHRREALATLLWPESANALRNLRKSLHRLRETLDRCEAGLSDDLLVITRQTVMLKETAVSLDTIHFEQTITQAVSHSHTTLADCPDCLAALETAVGLYQGDFLSGLSLPDAAGFEEWLLIKREKLHQTALTTLRQLADAYEQQGVFEKAQQYAAQQTGLEPWHEGAYRQMMRVLAEQGRRAEAVAQYDVCRKVLAAELGVEPSPETRSLHEQISQEDQPRKPADTPLSLHHFPTQFNQFVGRDEEVTAVIQHLLDPHCRLLTLVGPGGMGKTRLSIEAVQQATAQHSAPFADYFPDGATFVALADATDRDLLVASIAKALDITFQAADDPEMQLLHYLADKKALLVLDNFEQLVETATSARLSAGVFIAQILSEASHIQLLISSREPLNLQAEWRLPLDGLSYPRIDTRRGLSLSKPRLRLRQAQPSVTEPVEVVTGDATDLFMQTAQRVCPTFQPDEAEWQAILHICQLTQGIPLALQIAAAWTRVTDCPTIAAEITRNIDFLATTTRDMPMRHRSMRAVFDQSWHSLSPAEQKRLAQISVFAGGFELDAALFVMAGSIVELSMLLDKSLLRRTGNTNSELGRNGRYEIHKLLRQFAAEKLKAWADDVAEQTHHQHSAYYLRFIAAQKDAFSRSKTGLSWEAAEAEINNIRQAWAWAVAHGQWDEIADALDGMSLYYHLHGLFQEGLATFSAASSQLEAALGELDEKTAVGTLNQLHYQQIRLLVEQNNYADALQLAQTTSHSCREAGDERGLSAVLAELGIAHWRLDDNVNARVYLTESLALAKQLELPRQMAHALHHLGNIATLQRENEKALGLLQEAIALYEEVGDLRDLANVLNDLGSFILTEDTFSDAQTYFDRSVSLHRKCNNVAGCIIPLGNLGYLALMNGDYETAVKYFEEITPFTKKYRLDTSYVNNLNNLGHVALMQEDYPTAVQHYQESLRFAVSPANKSETLLGLTAVIVGLGDMKTAVALLPLPDEMLLFGSFEEKIYQRTIATIHTVFSDTEWEMASTQQSAPLDEKVSDALAYLNKWETTHTKSNQDGSEIDN